MRVADTFCVRRLLLGPKRGESCPLILTTPPASHPSHRKASKLLAPPNDGRGAALRTVAAASPAPSSRPQLSPLPTLVLLVLVLVPPVVESGNRARTLACSK